MTSEQIQNYSRRVANSSRSELVVITYDIILTYFEAATESYEKGDIDSFLFNIKKSRQFVNDLTSNLNFDYAISMELFNLYSFIDRTLFQCVLKKTPINMDCLTEMITKLKRSFEEIAKSDNSGKAMDHAEQIYAGYTYTKGTNNQIELNESIKRSI